MASDATAQASSVPSRLSWSELPSQCIFVVFCVYKRERVGVASRVRVTLANVRRLPLGTVARFYLVCGNGTVTVCVRYLLFMCVKL